jgi:hypothetical protein
LPRGPKVPAQVSLDPPCCDFRPHRFSFFIRMIPARRPPQRSAGIMRLLLATLFVVADSTLQLALSTLPPELILLI